MASGATGVSLQAGVWYEFRIRVRDRGDRTEIRIRAWEEGQPEPFGWQIDDNWSCSVEAAYDDYNDKNSNAYDGTVVSTMASLSRTW